MEITITNFKYAFARLFEKRGYQTEMQSAMQMLFRANSIPLNYGYYYNEDIQAFIFGNASSLEDCITAAGRACAYAREIARITTPVLDFKAVGGVRIPNSNFVFSFRNGEITQMNPERLRKLWMEDWAKCNSIEHALQLAKGRSHAFSDSLYSISNVDDIENEEFHPSLPNPISILRGGDYTRITTGGNILQIRGNKYRLGTILNRDKQPSHLQGKITPQMVYICDFNSFAD